MRNMRTLRYASKTSQRDLADNLRLAFVTIQKTETDANYDPRWSTVAKLADYFGVSADYLMGRYTDSTRYEMKNRLDSEFTQAELDAAYNFILTMRQLYNKDDKQ